MMSPFSGWSMCMLIIMCACTCCVRAQSSVAASTSASASVVKAASSSAVTPVVSTALTSSTPTATSTYTGTPYLTFPFLPTQTACGLTHVFFNVFGEDPSKVNITLYVMNAGVDQALPSAPASTVSVSASAKPSSATPATSRASSSASSPTVAASPATTSRAAIVTSAVITPAAASTRPAVTARGLLADRTTLDINITLVTQQANHGWDWNPLRLPEGRYYFLGVVHDQYRTTNRSNVFSVVEGSDTACLAAFASQSLTASHQASSTKGGAGTSGAGSAQPAEGASGKKVGSGAIAGIVVGVLLALAAAAVALLCYRRRKDRRYGEPRSGLGGMLGLARHRKMASQSTGPSDSVYAHGKGPIALAAMRQPGSYRSDLEEKNGPAPDVLSSGAVPYAAGTGPAPTNPFLTPSPGSTPAPAISAAGPASSATLKQSGLVGLGIATTPGAPGSGTPSTPAAVPGQGSPPASGSHSRRVSTSEAGTPVTPGMTRSASGPGLARSGSTRRKPVPSLGPELRGELAKGTSDKDKQLEERRRSSGAPMLGSIPGMGEGGRESFQLMPDPPNRQG
ncbi:hypothetical protein IAU60_001672 [Kwoniella sp. DSM 27419]